MIIYLYHLVYINKCYICDVFTQRYSWLLPLTNATFLAFSCHVNLVFLLSSILLLLLLLLYTLLQRFFLSFKLAGYHFLTLSVKQSEENVQFEESKIIKNNNFWRTTRVRVACAVAIINAFLKINKYLYVYAYQKKSF